MSISESRGAPPEKRDIIAAPDLRHRSSARSIKPPRWLKYAVFVAALVPLLWVAAVFVSDVFLRTRHLGSNPIKAAEHFTGQWTLRFLMLSLAITPAIALTRQGWLIRYRRTLGLFAFAYACVHLLIYFVLDVELTWSDFAKDIVKRKYITIGMTALLLLLPLAVTSTKGWIRRLGTRRWIAIHRLVYVVVVLGCIHFYMAVKRDVTEPLVYATVFAVLLGYRAVQWQRTRERRTEVGVATHA